MAGSTLTLNLGYSHPVEMPVPKGLEVKVGHGVGGAGHGVGGNEEWGWAGGVFVAE